MLRYSEPVILGYLSPGENNKVPTVKGFTLDRTNWQRTKHHKSLCGGLGAKDPVGDTEKGYSHL